MITLPSIKLNIGNFRWSLEGLFTQKNPRTPPKKSEKKSENNSKIPKILLCEFCENLNRIPYLGVNNPSISVFKSFFIHKILVHPKKSGNKSGKKPKKSEDYFEDLKSVYHIWECTTPRDHCFIELCSSIKMTNDIGSWSLKLVRSRQMVPARRVEVERTTLTKTSQCDLLCSPHHQYVGVIHDCSLH